MSMTTVIRYQTTRETAARNRELIEQVFAALAELRPDGLHYAAYQLDDGISFLHVVTTDDGTDPLAALPAFQEFQHTIRDRLTVAPDRTAARQLGSFHP